MNPWKFPRLARHWVLASIAGLVLVSVAALGGIVVYAGLYDIAADAPHTRPVFWLMQTVRDRSIAVRARDVAAPSDLANPKRIAAGASLYAEMCTGCHLAPGMERTEMSQGLYPKAPELARGIALTPGEEFWAIKHGIKMTGMPAWGVTHDDTLIWDMVAFLRKLPNLTPAEYALIVKSAPESHDEMMQMPGMDMSGSGDKPKK